MICIIQYFEADLLWKAFLKIMNSGLIPKAFTYVKKTAHSLFITNLITPSKRSMDIFSLYSLFENRVDPDQLASDEAS